MNRHPGSSPSGAIVFAATLIACAFAWDAGPGIALTYASLFGFITGLIVWAREASS